MSPGTTTMVPTVMLVCGGRDYDDHQVMFRVLDALMVQSGGINRVIHGGARGADTLAGEWARQQGLPCDVVKADWEVHGKAAGPMRNAAMLEILKRHRDNGTRCIVVAFHGGRGTADMVRRATGSDFYVVEV